MDSHLLIELLVERGLADVRSAEQLHADFERSERDLFDFLEAIGFGRTEEILRFVASEQGRQFVDLDDVELSDGLITSVDADVLRIFECLPLEVSEAKVKICITDPFDDVAVRELGDVLGKSVEVAVADPEKIRAILSRITNAEPPVHRADIAALPLGYREESKTVASPRQGNIFTSALLLALSVLAIAATAVSALYVSQNKRVETWTELVGKNEALVRQSDVARQKTEAAVVQINTDLDALEKVLTRKEVDGIRIDALEKELRELRGKMESLGKILSKIDVPNGVNKVDQEAKLGGIQ